MDSESDVPLGHASYSYYEDRFAHRIRIVNKARRSDWKTGIGLLVLAFGYVVFTLLYAIRLAFLG